MLQCRHEDPKIDWRKKVLKGSQTPDQREQWERPRRRRQMQLPNPDDRGCIEKRNRCHPHADTKALGDRWCKVTRSDEWSTERYHHSTLKDIHLDFPQRGKESNCWESWVNSLHETHLCSPHKCDLCLYEPPTGVDSASNLQWRRRKNKAGASGMSSPPLRQTSAWRLEHSVSPQGGYCTGCEHAFLTSGWSKFLGEELLECWHVCSAKSLQGAGWEAAGKHELVAKWHKCCPNRDDSWCTHRWASGWNHHRQSGSAARWMHKDDNGWDKECRVCEEVGGVREE